MLLPNVVYIAWQACSVCNYDSARARTKPSQVCNQRGAASSHVILGNHCGQLCCCSYCMGVSWVLVLVEQSSFFFLECQVTTCCVCSQWRVKRVNSLAGRLCSILRSIWSVQRQVCPEWQCQTRFQTGSCYRHEDHSISKAPSCLCLHSRVTCDHEYDMYFIE